MIYRKRCHVCQRVYDIQCNTARFWEWQDSLKTGKGRLIQDIFPELSEDDRELMISGVCGECFDNMFKEECENGCCCNSHRTFNR